MASHLSPNGSIFHKPLLIPAITVARVGNLACHVLCSGKPTTKTKDISELAKQGDTTRCVGNRTRDCSMSPAGGSKNRKDGILIELVQRPCARPFGLSEPLVSEEALAIVEGVRRDLTQLPVL